MEKLIKRFINERGSALSAYILKDINDVYVVIEIPGNYENDIWGSYLFRVKDGTICKDRRSSVLSRMKDEMGYGDGVLNVFRMPIWFFFAFFINDDAFTENLLCFINGNTNAAICIPDFIDAVRKYRDDKAPESWKEHNGIANGK